MLLQFWFVFWFVSSLNSKWSMPKLSHLPTLMPIHDQRHAAQNKRSWKTTTPPPTSWMKNVALSQRPPPSSSSGIVYRRFIAQFKLKSVGFTTAWWCVSPPVAKISLQSIWDFENWNGEPARHNQAPRYPLPGERPPPIQIPRQLVAPAQISCTDAYELSDRGIQPGET